MNAHCASRFQPDGLASCIFLQLFLLLVGFHQTAQSQTFTNLGGTGLPIGGAAAVADFDNDDHFDVLVQNGPTRLYRNDGAEHFTNILTLPIQSGVATAVGDYDNDGLLDLLICGLDQNSRYTTLLLHNLGTGSFVTNTAGGLVNVAYGAAAWGDYNNDGRVDLLLCGETNGFGVVTSRLYRNNRDGTFTDVEAGLAGISDGWAEWGDFDNDGRLDILLCGRTTGSRPITKLYHNNGDGTFTDLSVNLPGIWVGKAVWGDYDNDGFLDILMVGSRNSSHVAIGRIYRNDHDGTFSDLSADIANLSFASAAWGDFNHDGQLDVLVTGRTNQTAAAITKLCLNEGNGTFADSQTGLPGVFWATAMGADFDHDNRLDILLSWDGFTRIYRNTAPTSNTPPSAPANLGVTILPHNNIWLSWSPASDLETTNSSGLNYNLRVGTTPGGIDVLSPEANSSSGLRRIPRRGNAGSTNWWLLANLPKGTYYWSVQSIDPCFLGSAFASESSFTLTNEVDFNSNRTPIASSQSLTVPEDETLPIILNGSDPDGDPLTWIISRVPTNGVLRGLPPNLVYVPATNFFGPDGFTWRTYDGLTNSTTEAISITVTPVPDITDVHLTIQRNDPFIDVVYTGEPRVTYILDSSDDLVNWTVRSTGYNLLATPSVFTDYSPGPTNRFFRLRTAP